jgi:hypothetical protein
MRDIAYRELECFEDLLSLAKQKQLPSLAARIAIDTFCDLSLVPPDGPLRLSPEFASKLQRSLGRQALLVWALQQLGIPADVASVIEDAEEEEEGEEEEEEEEEEGRHHRYRR